MSGELISTQEGLSLHLVATEEAAELMIVCGADVNAVDCAGLAPLHHAATHGRKDVAGVLIESGADLNAEQMQSGWTPLFLAASEEIAEVLVNAGADIQHRDNKGRTPLHKAAEDGRADVVEFLIAHGAGVDDRDSEGWSPLHYAARWCGNDEVVGILLFFGADSTIMNRSGMTPCDLAASTNHRPVVPTLRTLTRAV